uniref:HECT-type E3 ubiquitin transferase n=1 Tax=Ciona savignyi TaxID=51511 RepID=H2Z542_CIOSA
RFGELCKYLVHNTETNDNAKTCYIGLSIHKQLVVSWINQVKKLLWTCCLYLDQNQPQFQTNEGDLVEVFLKMLVTFTDVVHWKALAKLTTMHAVLAQLCGRFLSYLNERGGHCVLASVLNSAVKSTQNLFVIKSGFNIAMRIISSGDVNDQVLAFTLHFLTIPAIIWHLQLKATECVDELASTGMLRRAILLFQAEGACLKNGLIPHQYSSNAVISVLCALANFVHLFILEKETLVELHTQCVSLMNQLVKFLYENTTQHKSNLTTWHPVLGYFNNSDAGHSPSMQFVKRQLEYMWEPVLVRAFFHDVLTLNSLHDDTSVPVQAEQLSKPKSKTKRRLSSYLKKMASSRPRQSLLPTGGRKLEYVEVKTTCLTCLLYKRSLSVFTKQLHLEMLTGLTFMDEVLCRLWRFICELGPSGGLQIFISSLSLRHAEADPYFAVFTLFCDMTSHILSILDDVEFYDLQIPFHLEELVTISSFLCRFVFKLIWSNVVKVEKSQPRGKLIVDKIPFMLPHKDRVLLFRSFVTADKLKLGGSITFTISDSEPMVHIRIHRSRLVEDGFEQLAAMQANSLKGVIRVKFINDLGLDEAGIDQDGVFKEFLEEIITKVFNPDMNLFKVTAGGDMKLYPSPLSHLQDQHLLLFNFVGKILGKAIYEGIVLDIPFANFFLRNLQGQQHTALYSPIDELPSLDPEFYKNLTWIKRYEGDISDLDLTFTYEEDIMGSVHSHELIPGGAATPVTNENRIMYIHTLAHYRLHTQILQQTKAFISGFRAVIPKSWTSMFSAPELQRLISGDNVDVDLTDLKKHVVYYGGFHSTHRVVRWLWDILERDYSSSERSAFLKFVTSCSRPPLLGFVHLQPQFSIRCVEVPDDEDTGDTVATVLRGFLRLPSKSRRAHNYNHRLPTASTCFNLLKLPNYPSKDVLRDKLKQAIANNTGFELS